MSSYRVNRREFIGITAASIAGGALGLNTPASAGTAGMRPDRWSVPARL